METNKLYQEPVYIVIEGEVTEMTSGEYLDEYCRDETTSPRGVEPREHIECAECGKLHSVTATSADTECLGIDCDSTDAYVRTFGTGGNNPRRISDRLSFESAWQEVCLGFENYREKDDQNGFFASEAEALEYAEENPSGTTVSHY